MQLYFGLRLDDNFLPYAPSHEGGKKYLGPTGLLGELEAHIGLVGHNNNLEYLRIEQYRQACIRHSKKDENQENPPFYMAAFNADPFAVAADLLSRRDELLLSDWDFSVSEDTPSRLKVIAEIEECCVGEDVKRLSPGFSDRFIAVEAALATRKQPFKFVYLNEPADILPPHFLRLFKSILPEVFCVNAF